eukprot:TRINITY_DN23594_c0_g1_i10.p1 TRINITY_DN23594_c0_g1~~TRINITY_DN23594_c0_g1_i10.p1  ORF type:complete len:168 (-),score=4.52 TRINITY_DN23594_c0_g1_i10:323-826(-)
MLETHTMCIYSCAGRSTTVPGLVCRLLRGAHLDSAARDVAPCKRRWGLSVACSCIDRPPDQLCRIAVLQGAFEAVIAWLHLLDHVEHYSSWFFNAITIEVQVACPLHEDVKLRGQSRNLKPLFGVFPGDATEWSLTPDVAGTQGSYGRLRGVGDLANSPGLHPFLCM